MNKNSRTDRGTFEISNSTAHCCFPLISYDEEDHEISSSGLIAIEKLRLVDWIPVIGWLNTCNWSVEHRPQSFVKVREWLMYTFKCHTRFCFIIYSFIHSFYSLMSLKTIKYLISFVQLSFKIETVKWAPHKWSKWMKNWINQERMLCFTTWAVNFPELKGVLRYKPRSHY